MTNRLPIVGVMGAGDHAHRDLAEPLGRGLAQIGVHLLTGGGPGVMAAVSRAFAEVGDRVGLVIGVLPLMEGNPEKTGLPAPYPNRWVEIPIQTHLGRLGVDPLSRNHINVLASDVVVALPGSVGTASEVELAIAYRRPIVLLGDLDRAKGLPASVATASSVAAALAFVRRELGARQAAPTGRGRER